MPLRFSTRLVPVLAAAVATAYAVAACVDPTTAATHSPARAPSALRVCTSPGDYGCGDPTDPTPPPPPPPAPSSPGNAYGINVSRLWSEGPLYDRGLQDMLPYLTDAGITWVRFPIGWAGLQPLVTPANYDCANPATFVLQRDPSTWSWAAYDSMYTRANRAGLNVLGILQYTPRDESLAPCDVANGNYTNYGPRDLAAWRNYVAAVVGHYPAVKYWEIWDEPNGDNLSNSPSGQPRASVYADLVNNAAPIIHAAGGQVLVLSDNDDYPVDNPGQAFNSAAFGGANHILPANADILAVHAYIGASNVAGLIQHTQAAVRAVSSTAAASRVWVTETGYVNDNPPSQQAESLDVAGVLSAQKQVTGWEKTFYWHSHIHRPVDNDDRGILTGVYTDQIAATPAYNAYRAIARPPGQPCNDCRPWIPLPGGPWAATAPGSQGRGRASR